MGESNACRCNGHRWIEDASYTMLAGNGQRIDGRRWWAVFGNVPEICKLLPRPMTTDYRMCYANLVVTTVDSPVLLTRRSLPVCRVFCYKLHRFKWTIWLATIKSASVPVTWASMTGHPCGNVAVVAIIAMTSFRLALGEQYCPRTDAALHTGWSVGN